MRPLSCNRALVVILFVVSALSLFAGAPAAESRSVAVESFDLADDAWSNREWAEAAAAYRGLVEENPYQGEFWYRLATALYNLQDYEASAEAYTVSAQLGFEKGTSLYNKGCCLALVGQGEAAVTVIEQAIASGLRNREQLIREDSDLDSIRNTASFHERIFPAIDDGASRVERWRVDLDYMTMRLERTHYDLYRSVTPDEWSRSVAAIKEHIEEMQDHEIIVSVMQLMAKVDDGHSGVRPPTGGENGWHRIPARFYIFKDGVFIKDASVDYQSAVGKRVVRVGNLPVDEALAQVATVTQRDNSQQIKWMAPYWMSWAEVLHGLGISDGLDHVDLVLADADGRESAVRFATERAAPRLHGHDNDMMTLADNATAPPPLWRKDLGNWYWYEYLADERLVYWQFNVVNDKRDGESVADFAKRLFAFIDANDVGALVIDVRRNNGGNNYKTKAIIDEVIRSDKINQRGRLFVIIGRETFSACQNFVNRLERESQPIFVGEPTGSRPNFVGEDNKIQLPYSDLIVRGSSRYWQDTRSDDYRTWIAPQLVAEMTSTDFMTNRDPAMDVIREYRSQAGQASDRLAQ